MNAETKLSHTPGPWTIKDLGGPNHAKTLDYRILICAPNGDLPCTIDYSGNEPETYGESSRADHAAEAAQARANARLIAAAPDLLEGNRRSLAFVESMPGAKAEGGAA